MFRETPSPLLDRWTEPRATERSRKLMPREGITTLGSGEIAPPSRKNREKLHNMKKIQYYILTLFVGVVCLSRTVVGQTTVGPATRTGFSSSDRNSNGYVPIFLRTVAGSSSSINNSSNNFNNMTNSSSSSDSGINVRVFQSPGISRKSVPSVVVAAEIQPPYPSGNQSSASGAPKLQNTGSSSSGSGSQIFNVLDIVQNLDIRLKNIRNVELGVTIVQEIFDAVDFTTPIHDDNDTVAKLAARIRTKINLARTVVANLSDFIRTNVTDRQIRDDNLFLNTLIHPCPFDDFTLEQNYNSKQIQILNYLKINGYRDVHDRNFTVNTEIVAALRRSMHSSVPGIAPSHFKHAFFLSRHDHASDHNCQYYFNDLNFRQLYTSAIREKYVFFLIDCGNSVAGEQIELSKQFVSNVVQMLAADDTITIVAVNNRIEVMQLKGQSSRRDATMRYRTTMDRKDEIQHFIGQLAPSKELTNHSLGFQYAFELLNRQNISKGTPLEFVYVTRGLMSSLTEAKTVLDTIATGQAHLNEPITVNTCAVILDEKRVMYEKQFLHDIAQQNYTKYEINVTRWYDPNRHRIRGNMFMITKRHPELIIKTSSAIFEKLFENHNVSDEIRYHLPVLDYNTKDVIVSITKPIPQYGVVGINLYLNDLAEEIVYFKRTEDSYTFLIDMNGMVIYHPAFPRPVATVKPLYPVEIRYLEAQIDRNLNRRILHESNGNETIVQSGDNETKITYTWNRVLDAYVVCLRSTLKLNGKLARIQMSSGRTRFVDQYQQHIDATSSSELLYHRIDLIPPPQTPVCRHFRQIATLDTGTIFLSASAFKSPFIYMKNNREIKDETQRTHNAQSIMAYIKDISNLLANPGLQVQIRNDVSVLLHVMAYLKKRHLENGGLLKKYIIRRYAATTNGVLQVYPGCILGTDLEPTRRPWFRKAMKHSGRIVLTEPYLDAGGAGFIVTIAHTIFEGKSNALHNSERDLPIAIVALDVPYGFMYKLLLESAQLCSETNIKCLLMEDEGYLLAHPSIMEPATANLNNRRPLEHITHKESFVANDILNHKRLVRKKACATFQNRVAQRYYEFNTSLTQVLTNNVVHGERTKYQITAIPFTNIFAAVLNSTCEGGAFCPCSTSDRVCLNCNRMDQADCECPCECTLRYRDGEDYEKGVAEEERNAMTLRYCEPAVESLAVVNSLSYDWSIVVKSCMNINCEMFASHADCLGVMGCEWCQLDIDLNPFPSPFCTAQNSCFNGVLGSVTPYGDGDLGSAIIEPVSAPAYSAIGPVGGAIIVLFLVVGFAMYCYRQNLDNGSEHLYGADSMQDDNYGVPLSRFNFDDISPHDDSDMSGGGGGGGGVGGANTMHRNLLHPLANVIAVNDLSPYHMSGSGYRRPNGESDHGYSTMTPHEDSEHMCFTLVEPLINNHKRLSMSADSMSITTSVSSPTNQPPQLVAIDRPPANFDGRRQTSEGDDEGGVKFNYTPPGQTTFLEQVSPHHILAPVTVHRHMEAL